MSRIKADFSSFGFLKTSGQNFTQFLFIMQTNMYFDNSYILTIDKNFFKFKIVNVEFDPDLFADM